MKPVSIVAAVILALASNSSVARPQTKDVRGQAIGKVQKAAQLNQVANYPTAHNASVRLSNYYCLTSS
jgi:uncharacterized protein YpmB